ncbi:MAG: amidohydrolase family protein [Myxococcales bacterium]|nr:amidohydrolase family protein [Myxococcales bacterium]
MMIGWLVLQVGTAWATCSVISGAEVHTAEGPQKGLTVVVKDDRIAATGRGIEGLQLELSSQKEVAGARWQGEDCTFVQGAGQQLTAGFVAVPTQMGLVEVGLEPGTRHDNPETDDPIRASLAVADAYDPRSSLIAVNRMEGITTALAAPGGAFVAGQAALVRLSGDTQDEAVLFEDAAMMVNLPSSSFAEGLRQLRELVDEVDAWRRNKALYDRGRPGIHGLSRMDLEALLPAVRGQQPVVIRADRASQIEALLRLQRDTGMRLVIAGAAEGWRVADALAAASVPVIIDPLVYGPGGFDQRAGRADNGALLMEAGVSVILTTNSTHNARTLRQAAGNAVRGGMDHADALDAISRIPAEVFGLRGAGQIAVGAPADLVLWSGDPLEVTTSARGLWIGGEAIELSSRQRKLAERYLTLPATPAPLPVE